MIEDEYDNMIMMIRMKMIMMMVMTIIMMKKETIPEVGV